MATIFQFLKSAVCILQAFKCDGTFSKQKMYHHFTDMWSKVGILGVEEGESARLDQISTCPTDDMVYI